MNTLATRTTHSAHPQLGRRDVGLLRQMKPLNMNSKIVCPTWLLYSLVLCASIWASPAQAKRVALLIGNARYSVGALTNPPNDVREIQAALKAVGFDDIRVLQDADQKAMKKAIRDFGDKAEGADLAFLYYSGHGTQANGRNYLIPINASIDKESDYEIEAVVANGVLEQIAGARPKAAVVVLDACRDNPVATARSGTKGLSRMDAPTGTMIAFSTAPNKTASDEGYYARVLAQQIRSPGLELLDVFRRTTAEVRRLSQGRQEPRVSEVSISDSVYFGNWQVASMDPSPVLRLPAGPSAGAVNFSDLEQARRDEAASRQQWADWQLRMKSDFNKANSFSGSAELESKAWERFLQTYAENNPYSNEDEDLRTAAQTSLSRISRSPAGASQIASSGQSLRRPEPRSESALAMQQQAPFRDWEEARLQFARRIVAANPEGSYLGKVPDLMLAIPILSVELAADGSVQEIKVLRVPSQAKDTVELAKAAILRAAPFGDISNLTRPWKFTESFLFNSERKFKPMTLDQR
jgi:Caspase domain